MVVNEMIFIYNIYHVMDNIFNQKIEISAS